MAVQAHQDYNMCLLDHHSPNQSPLSTSPIPDQSNSPRGGGANMIGQEHNWYIILEPNGNSNVVHFNSPTGETVASFIANCGDMIEFEPGVFFQVPYPQQPGPMPIQPVPQPIHQPQPMYLNTSVQNIQNTNIMPNGYNSHEFNVNPYCPSHGNANTTNNFSQSNGRAEKRREKLQKKLRDKNQSTCTCKQNVMPYNGHNGHNGRLTSHTDGVPVLPEDNGFHNLDSNEHLDVEKDMTICVPPKTMAESSYAIILTWDECILNNNHLQGCFFDLQMSDSRNKYKSVFSGQSSTFRASELQPGTQYFFRLCALWNNNRGPFSDPVSCTTLQTKPTNPSMLRVIQKTKTALTLKWNAPINDGGSSITSYTLQWLKGQEQEQFSDLFTGLQKQFKHSHKLPPGTQCTFRVLATNELGSSDWSDVMRCLTSAGPPAAPDSPKSVDCGTNFIRLIWHESDNNGAPVEEYKLEMEDPADGYGFISKYHGEKTSYCCQNLRRNTTYTFRLSASNSQGFSRPSPPISYMTLPEAPGKMEKPKVNGKPKTSSISIKWEPPRDSGGNETISYILEVDDGKGGHLNPIYQGSDRDFTLSNLKPGCTYKIRVVSESKAGKGTWSPILQASTLPVCPRDCQPPVCHKTEPTGLQLEWDEPETGGAKISNYVIQMAAPCEEEFKEVYTGCKRTCRVTELLPGTDYQFKMQASNQAGTSQWSTVSRLTTAPSPPDAPDVPVVSFKTPTNLRLDWAEPGLHGVNVTSYTVEKLENDSFQKVYQGTCCFCEVKRNLNPATHYYFRLQAHSTAGDSPYSDVFTIEMPPSVPGAVTEIKVIEQTSNSSLVQWRHPTDHGSRVYEYILEATGATSMICTAPRPNPSSLDVTTTSLDGSTRSDRSDRGSTMEGESDMEESDCEEGISNESIHSEASSLTASKLNDEYMEYRLTGLTADASYRLRIQAVNSVGTGLFSHPIQFYTKELPPSPPTLTASSISHHSIKLKWGSSSSKKSLSVLNHCLQIQNKSGSFSQVYDGMSTSYTINKLNELTPYCCRIRSKNDAGEGDFSQPKIFYTKARPPPTLKDLECTNITNTSLNISWAPIEKKIRPDDVIEYRLQMLDQDTGKDFKQVYQGANHSYEVKDLKPESSYSFRVHAVRQLSESARMSTPTSTSEIKGAFSSPLLRAKTYSEKAMEESVENDTVDTTPQEETQSCKLTDTHIALIILSTFLIICALIAGILRWVLSDAQL